MKHFIRSYHFKTFLVVDSRGRRYRNGNSKTKTNQPKRRLFVFFRAVEMEKARADRFEGMLEDSRSERDAECERLTQNIDSLKEQLDVSVACGSYRQLFYWC